MNIRQMTEMDIEQVAAIENTIFSVPWTVKGFADTLYMENVSFSVAEKDREILGYCGLYMALDEGEITNVAVKEEYRRQNIADKLLDETILLGEKKGLSKIFLEVRSSNLAAIRLYEKHGFEKVGVRKNFYEKPTENADVMLKTIR